MELIKYYDYEILYHPGNANVVADVLSRKSQVKAQCYVITHSSMKSSLISNLRIYQTEAPNESRLKSEHMVGYAPHLSLDSRGLRLFKTPMWVPKSGSLRDILLHEAQKTMYSMHRGSTKMYHNIKADYWWPGMKRDAGRYVEQCLVCLQVKVEHQKSYEKLQPLEILEWKWEAITMDFITKLPKMLHQQYSIWVIVDRLTKSAHFLAIREFYSLEMLAEIYVKEIISRYGTPLRIVSDRDPRFTSRFWQSLQCEMGTRVTLSTGYHPQTDNHIERVIQILEDMLRACVIEFGGNWDSHLPLVEFAYNNSSQASLGMALFEALYGRRCRTPACWKETGERPLTGPELVQDTHDKGKIIHERLKEAQDRYKSYSDRRHKPIEFDVDDMVMLKVSLWKGVIRFGKRGKLSPRFISTFRILERVEIQAYRLELPPELADIHNVFHVSYLRKCLADVHEVVPLHDVRIDDKLRYIEEPECILNEKVFKLRNKRLKWF